MNVLKKTLAFVFICCSLAVIYFTSNFLKNILTSSQGNVLSDTILCNGISPCYHTGVPPVDVRGFIRVQQITFTVHPERRIPPTNNWDTFANVQLRNCSTNANYNYNNIATNTFGTGTINVPVNNQLPGATYRFFVKGYSHLNRQFNCYLINKNSQYIDLSLEGKELLAGEVSNVYDNYINSLDMSVLIANLFTASYKNDLNQDGLVNSLDFSTQIKNLFVNGD